MPKATATKPVAKVKFDTDDEICQEEVAMLELQVKQELLQYAELKV